MKKSILKEGRKYTFSDYFELNNPTEEIVGEFGYFFTLEAIDLPTSKEYDREAIKNLKDTFYKVLPKIAMTSEISKREFLIAPILIEIAKVTDSKINVEYPIEIDDKLSGSVDYLLRSTQELIVIEAKKGDLDKGFNQLAVELIALDKYQDNNLTAFYGAISIGEVWRFGMLKRDIKHIFKDIHTYRVPEDVEQVYAILLGILA